MNLIQNVSLVHRLSPSSVPSSPPPSSRSQTVDVLRSRVLPIPPLHGLRVHFSLVTMPHRAGLSLIVLVPLNGRIVNNHQSAFWYPYQPHTLGPAFVGSAQVTIYQTISPRPDYLLWRVQGHPPMCPTLSFLAEQRIHLSFPSTVIYWPLWLRWSCYCL